MSFRQACVPDGFHFAAMDHRRCHQPEAAVTVVMVVPGENLRQNVVASSISGSASLALSWSASLQPTTWRLKISRITYK